MKFKSINIKNLYERSIYSKKLQVFENEFTYPLNNTTFHIQHGNNKENDYFSFFEQMGDVHFLVIEENEKIIGCIGLILRKISYKKIWYICDFKISKNYRGKKIYRFLMYKYFFKYYLKSQEFFAINMSPKENNRLFKHTQRIFKLFNVKANDSFLHTFTLSDYLNNKEMFKDYYFVTNDSIKDIIIDSKQESILHLVNKSNNLNFKNIVKFEKIQLNQTVMLLNNVKEKLFLNDNVQEICIINNTNLNLIVSSAEI